MKLKKDLKDFVILFQMMLQKKIRRERLIDNAQNASMLKTADFIMPMVIASKKDANMNNLFHYC